MLALGILTTKESDMITLLIEGVGITDIAKKLNVTRQTIYNWSSKDNVKAEFDRRRQELTRQGNNIIMKDITTYIDNIKVLANDKSDKRVSLAANQYLLNRVYGNPTCTIEDNSSENNNNLNENELEKELNEFTQIRRIK
ncbi:helix-turn-helix domain-containing protein [Clostridium botulinum]|uniref:helix-turn-helix domain-containing protein n=1 Tax=Clostridium botulinum TaxID=1491 RepID=UPI001FA70EBD|nr:helix-turn-helix domain-containing protein [Clostridium botulinum]MCW6073504.1 helix-turn-helix domain containing protein [Clostridium botulinum]